MQARGALIATLGCGGVFRDEAKEQHGDGEHDMQPCVGRIIRNQAEDQPITDNEAHDRDEGVNQTENTEPHPGRAWAGHAGNKENDSGSDMHNTVSGIDHENPQ